MNDNLKINDSDIATIEMLHDFILDSGELSLSHPMLKRSRNLTARMYKILSHNIIENTETLKLELK